MSLTHRHREQVESSHRPSHSFDRRTPLQAQQEDFPHATSMMLDHYQQTKNLLVSYDINPLGFF